MTIPKGQTIYFDHNLAEIFAEREENYRHKQTAEIFSSIILYALKNVPGPLQIADLGAGAHPDRYSKLYERLAQDNGSLFDWVDFSPYMLEIAKSFDQLANLISFIEKDFMDYLSQREADSLDAVIMKYTFEDVKDLEPLFGSLAKVLKVGGIMAATIQSSPEIKSVHSNARFLHRGEEFPEDETRTLEDGEEWQIKFYRETDNPNSGYIEGLETVKYFHSADTIRKLADQFGFNCFIGDWKTYLPVELQNNIKIDQSVLILSKK